MAVSPLGLVRTLQANLISAFLDTAVGQSCHFIVLSQSSAGSFLKPELPCYFLVVDPPHLQGLVLDVLPFKKAVAALAVWLS